MLQFYARVVVELELRYVQRPLYICSARMCNPATGLRMNNRTPDEQPAGRLINRKSPRPVAQPVRGYWRAGASQPSRTSGSDFYIYI